MLLRTNISNFWKGKLFFEVLDETMITLVSKNISAIRTILGEKLLTGIVPMISPSSQKKDDDNREYLKLTIISKYDANAKTSTAGFTTKFYELKDSKYVELNPQTRNDLEEVLKSGITGTCAISPGRILNNMYTNMNNSFRIAFSVKIIKIFV